MQIADALSQIVQWFINCAPFGVLGLVFTTISEQGLSSLLSYGSLILLLVGSMAFVPFIVNPLITLISLAQNFYIACCLSSDFLTLEVT